MKSRLTCLPRDVKLEHKELDSLLDVDDSHICASVQEGQLRRRPGANPRPMLTESKCLADHVSDEASVVADVEDGDDPVRNGGPAGAPGSAKAGSGITELHQSNAHEAPRLKLEVIDARVLHDIIGRVVEQVDKSSHADNRQRLHREDRKGEGGDCGGEDALVDAIVASCTIVHVHDVGESREEAAVQARGQPQPFPALEV